MKAPSALKAVPVWAWYLLLSLLAYAPALLKGECFFDNDLLGWFGPHWDFFRSALGKGEFPLWDPSLFGGQPFAADPQSLAFYPFMYPFLLFPVGFGLTFFLAFHVFFAAFGMDRWLEKLGVTSPSRRIGACLYALSGFFWVELIHPPVVAAAAWLPWYLASLESSAREPTAPQGFRAGWTFALLFLAGSLQVAVGAFYAGIFYAVVRRAYWARKSGRTFFPPGRFWAALLWGLLPLLVSAVPAAEFSFSSSRLQSSGSYASFNARGSLNPDGLLRFISPAHGLPPGTPLGSAVQHLDAQGDNSFQGVIGYLGPLALVLAALGLAEGSLGIWLGLLALGAVAVGLGRHLPLHRLLCETLPVVGYLKVPARYLFLYSLSMSALASFGLQRLDRRGMRSRGKGRSLSAWKWAVVGAAVCGPLLVMGWRFYSTGPARNFDYASNALFLKYAELAPPPARNFLSGNLPYRVWHGKEAFVTDFPVDATGSLGRRACTGYNPLMLESYQRLQTLPPEEFCRALGADRILSGRDHGKVSGFERKTSGPLFLYRTLEPSPPLRTVSLSNPKDASALSGFWLLFDGCNRQNYRVVMSAPSRVVFPDLHFPGWQVEVDGKRSDCLDHEGSRAVDLDRGSHEVVFRFKPFWWPWIPLAFMAWLFLTFSLARNPKYS